MSEAPPPTMARTRRTLRSSRMTGRDPDEAGRSATPLELLFDLTFVVAFGRAADLFAHSIAGGHTGSGLLSFSFAVFAICWAWINFSWFASAYDTDDWLFRVLTMVQMVGVVILALGLPAMFASIEEGHSAGNGLMVTGYVVMRISMVAQWFRASRQDPARRRACLAFIVTIVIAQVGWVALIVLNPSIPVTFGVAAGLIFIEMYGPVRAERLDGGTPWHAHHIAERYGLLTIIALGEGVIGTVASVSALVDVQGWTLQAGLLVVAGIGLTFGMWWMYFIVPSGEVLHLRRNRAFAWSYGHLLVFGSIVATGAGLHVAAYYIDEETELSANAAVLSVTIPVALYVLAIYGLYAYLVRDRDVFHLGLLLGTAAVLVAAGWLARAGVPMTTCLLVVMCAPVVTVVGYEVAGHRHAAAAVQRLVTPS